MPVFNFAAEHKIKSSFKEDLDNFLKTPENKILSEIIANKDDRFFLFQIMYPSVFNKIILKKKAAGYDGQNYLFINVEDFIYFLKVECLTKKVFNYVYSKLV